MKFPAVALPPPIDPARALPLADVLRWSVLLVCAAVLAGCASQTTPGLGRPGPGGRYFDPILGVWASPRVVDDGEAVPRGGGGFLVGRPYTIGGRLYVPNADPRGYAAVGTASWYGDAFHGRRTANGEIFDKGSISAAHPTLPLPSYVRVTNLNNGRSLIVRVNDRGPYHGGRVMDVSQRVAEALAFRNEGTGRVRIEYVGRATLAGDDEEKLLATLTTDGRPARLDGSGEPVQVADGALPPRPTGPSPLPNIPVRVASLPIFRRGPPTETPVPAVLPVEPSGTPRPARSLAVPVAAPGPRRLAPGRAGSTARDPFFIPLVSPQKREAALRAAIGFGGPAGRPVLPRRKRDASRDEAR